MAIRNQRLLLTLMSHVVSILTLASVLAVVVAPAMAGTRDVQMSEIGHPTFVSPHFNPIAIHGDRLFVANTPADTLDVFDSTTGRLIRRVACGVDPVSVGVRPDGKEVWVSNHVSDSVSVIDNTPDSPTELHVVATIQQFDDNLATMFDEPVGIAFAGNRKAYVALSSENQIAVIDVPSRQIIRRLKIPAQDPRGLVVRNNRLYVIPFESNNKTQLSGGRGDQIDGDLVTFDAWQHSIVHNNVLSLGHVVDIVKHPDVPDRDLFVFDTATDSLIETVDSLGTLLYGLTVAADGTVFVAQTDARNHINGRAGTKQHNLSQLQNRAFLNQLTRVGGNPGQREVVPIDLEPIPPQQPQPGQAFATPFAIQLCEDDSTLVVSAAGSNQVATVDARTGKVLGRITVDAVPRGIALQHEGDQLQAAWVLNAVANTLSRIDLSDVSSPELLQTVVLNDPTPDVVKRGRIAFETASASSTGTFSCASCHPDGHTDQLLWVLKTPVVTGGDQIMPRSTMPIRGLLDTEPYHWDGIPGDPYGGNNSANVHGNDPPNAVAGQPLTAARHLIDGGLASTMVFAKTTETNDEGKIGMLTAAERDAMAEFLLSVPYPPAQKRPLTNVVTDRARTGFQLFHVQGDNDPSKPQANVCGDCHRMPHLVSTNTPGTGMDAPTWRGAYDRFLILPQGRLNIVEFPFYRRVAEAGQSEEQIWKFSWGGRERFNPVWNMVLEMSTGYSGSFARQVTLSENTVTDKITLELLEALEQSAREGAIVLEAEGARLGEEAGGSEKLQFADGQYYSLTDTDIHRREDLLAAVSSGRLLLTFTGHHGRNWGLKKPAPALWTAGPLERQRGRQRFPVVTPEQLRFVVSGRHVDPEATIFLDGEAVAGQVVLQEDERLRIELQQMPEFGTHLLQLQNPAGQFSNDFLLTSAATRPDEKPARGAKGETLGETLKRTKWDRLIGEWVDEGSGGDGLKMTFRWKIDGRVLESESVEPSRTSVALISVNAGNGDIFQAGADSIGSSSLGTWKFRSNGEARLELVYTDGDGNQGGLGLRYRLIDDETLFLAVELPQPIEVRLKRVQPAER